MKKILITMLLIVPVLTASARGSGGELKIGLAGAFNSTWLINTNVSDAGDELDFKSTFGGQVGINLMLDLSETSGLSFGILYSGHNQDYKGKSGNSVYLYEIATSLRYIDIPILFRVGSMSQGAYFEIGPQIGFLSSAKESLTTTPTSLLSYTDRDVKSEFNSTDFAGVLGVGGSFDAGDDIMITIGLRLGYSFTDATVEHTEAELGLLVLENKYSYANAAAHYNRDGDYSYKPTNRAFGGLFVTVMYRLQ